MISTQLFCKALKFAAHAASKKDIRYYLVGVRLEWEGDVLDMVGTDGIRLARITLRTSVPSAAPVAAGIKLEDVKRILTVIGKDKGQVDLYIFNPDDRAKPPQVKITAAGVTLDLVGLEGVYPAWRRILPPDSRVVGCMPCVDANLLAEACEAVGAFTLPIKGSHFVQLLAGPNPLDVVNVTPAPGMLADNHLVLGCQVVVSPMRAPK